jgi:hypothetical protein
MTEPIDAPSGAGPDPALGAPPASARDTAQLEVLRTEIDGVPVFHLPDARRPGVALQFRVGRTDEPFPWMGITHVVEHLAMFTLGSRRHPANAFVDNIRTVFHANGSPAELAEYLSGVVAALTDLPMARLADELRILRTEAMTRSPSIWDLLAWYRYGCTGPGLMGVGEYGLSGLGAATVSAWSRDWFNRGNAALWIAGPIPDGLRLPLPEGTRRPIPPSVPIANLPLPAWTPGRIPGIALGLLVPRTFDASIGGRILTQRLEKHLRYELGRSYEVSIAYQPLDAREGMSSIFASCLDEDAEKVRAAFLSIVDQFAAGGPTEDELRDDRHDYDRSMEDPDAGYGFLDRAVHNELIGRPLDTPAAMRAELDAVTPDSVRDAFRAALDTAILMGPIGEAPQGVSARAWHQYPAWSEAWVEGEHLDRADRRFPWSKRTEELIVGRDGVTWIDHGPRRGITVRYADLVGLTIESDGARVLHGGDGFRVRVHAGDWDHGVQAVAAIESAVPPELVVRLAET